MLIDSPSNPTVKSLRSLAASSRQRREAGLFLVEGVRLVTDALEAGRAPQVCLYEPEALARSERGRALAAQLQALSRSHQGRIFEASSRALAAAADTQHSQGVVAAFPIPQLSAPAPGENTPLALVCDDIQDPGNLGTILRAAEAAGASAVWLTQRCVDLYSPKVVRAGMGAHFRLQCFPESDWREISAALEKLGIDRQHIFAAEADATVTYDRADWTAPSALIVSNEAHGLGPEARELATGGGGFISIPMLGGTESLNAAVAASVILFEAARQRRLAEK